MMNAIVLKFAVTFLFGSLVSSTVHCNEWVLSREYSYFRTLHVNSIEATSTPLYTSTCRSEMHCAWKCRVREASSYYFHNSDMVCECYNNLEHGHTGEQTPGTIFSLGRYTSVKESVKADYVKFDVKPGKSDCLQLIQDNFRQDGVYVINVNNVDVNVWCDMSDGGWTVIQRRRDGTEDFYRAWNDYKTGFGDPTNEHWIGLSHIHALTIQPSQLHIVLKTFGDREPVIAHVQYDFFSIGSESTAFMLNSSGYSGCDEVDPFYWANGKGFSTRDVDHDTYLEGSCANDYRGAWWFGACHACHLNGVYYHNPNLDHANWSQGISWYPCYTHEYSLKESEMKIKRKHG